MLSHPPPPPFPPHSTPALIVVLFTELPLRAITPVKAEYPGKNLDVMGDLGSSMVILLLKLESSKIVMGQKLNETVLYKLNDSPTPMYWDTCCV